MTLQLIVKGLRPAVALSILASMLVTAVVAAKSAATAAPPVRQAPRSASAERPEPPAVFTKVCAECHEAARVLEGRRSRSQWSEIIDEMLLQGARASDEESEAILAFLVSEYGRVNVNTADAAETAQVLHLEPTAAEVIVAYRKKHGKFADFDALIAVPGAPVEALKKQRNAIVF